MIFSGKNYRSLLEQDKFSFKADLSINNLTSSAAFGFSGENKSISFSFESGRIYDPENRYFGNYEANNVISISGNISGSSYDYYYNKSPICFVGVKESFKTQNFFTDTSGCNLNIIDVLVTAPKYDYTLDFATEFVLSGTITGSLKSVDTGRRFEIFSGEIISPGSFIFSGFEGGRTASSLISITPSGDINLYDSFAVKLNLYTNFGKINKTFSSQVLPEGGFLVALLNETRNNSKSQPFSGGDLGEIKTGDYDLTYSILDEFVPVTTSTPVGVSFQYYSGNTGNYYRVTGINITNSGTGYLESPVIIFNVPVGVKESIRAYGSGVLVNSGIASIVILNSGLYLSGLPTVTISGIGGSGALASGSVSGDYFYTKYFTGSWNIQTGIDSGSLIDFREAAYTGIDANGNLRYLSQTNVIPAGVVLMTRITYQNTSDNDPLIAKLEFSGINNASTLELFTGIR